MKTKTNAKNSTNKINTNTKAESQLKATGKAKVEGKVEKPVAKNDKVKKTISSVVLATFKNNPTIKSKDMIEIIKKQFPESKFNVYHFCWYRYQIKNGRYNKHFDKAQIEKIFAK